MIKIYLTSPDIAHSFLLPITPPEITVKCAREVRTYSTAYDGDINFIRSPGACEVSFESFLPGIYDRFARNNDKLGIAAVEEIKSFMQSPEPIRMVISGGGVNIRGTITEFNFWQGKGERIDYRLVFVEKKG